MEATQQAGDPGVQIALPVDPPTAAARRPFDWVSTGTEVVVY